MKLAPIKNHPGYRITPKGVIYSYRKKRRKVLAQSKRNDGYTQISLFNESGYRSTKLVHRLVAETYIDNPESFLEVNHINGKRSDNRVENLEWITHKENIKHGYGRADSNPRSKPVTMLSLKEEFIANFDSIREAADFLGLKSSGNIINVLKGRKKSTKDYKWRYTYE